MEGDTPGPRRTRISLAVWESHKEDIRRLFLVEKLPIKGDAGIRQKMAQLHGFFATESQYETRLKNWGFQKNATSREWQELDRCLQSREAAGKETDVYLYEEIVTSEKLRKQRMRYKFPGRSRLDESTLNQRLPECFRISTPPPDDRNGALTISGSPQNMPRDPIDHSSPTLFTFDPDVDIPLAMEGHIDDVTNMLYDPLGITSSTYNHHNTIDEDLMLMCHTMIESPWIPENGYGIGRLGSPSFNARLFANSPGLASSPPFGIPISIPEFQEWSNLGGTASMLQKIKKTITPMFAIVRDWISDQKELICAKDLSFANSYKTAAGHELQPQPLHVEVVYTVLFQFVNNMISLEHLREPQTAVDLLHKKVLGQFLSLPKKSFNQFLDVVPQPFRYGIERTMFCAAIVMGTAGVLACLFERGINFDNVKVLDKAPLVAASYLQHADVVDVILDQFPDSSKRHIIDSLESVLIQEDYEGTSSAVALQITGRLLRTNPIIDLNRMFLHNVRMFQDHRLLTTIVENVPGANYNILICSGILSDMLYRPRNEAITASVLCILNRPWPEEVRRKKLFQTTLTIGLSNAAYHNNHEIFQALIDFGGEPDVNCLRNAVAGYNMEKVRLLLDKGLSATKLTVTHPREPIKIEVNQNDVSTPLAEAIRVEFEDAVTLFKEMGCFSKLAESPNGFQHTLLAACEVGNEKLVGELLLHQDNTHFMGETIMSERYWDMQKVIQNGFMKLIPQLLQAGMNPDSKTLQVAVQIGDFGLFHLIMSTLSFFGKNSLAVHFAVAQGNMEFVEIMSDLGIPLNRACESETLKAHDRLKGVHGDEGYWPLLTTAILAGQGGMADALRQMGAPFDRGEVDFDGSHRATLASFVSPLTAAVRVGDHELVKTLLSWGANLDERVFLNAYTNGDLNTVKIFISTFRERHPTGKSVFGTSALHKAIMKADLHMVKLFAEITQLRTPLFKDENDSVVSALGLAITSKSKESTTMVRILKDNGCDMNSIVFERASYSVKVRDQSWTCLLYAISTRDLWRVRLIIELGANINLPARYDVRRTPLQHAVDIGSEEITLYLLQHGADPNGQPAVRGGGTAIQLASKHGNIGLAALLLQHGANVNAPGSMMHGRTAFEMAAEYGRVDMLLFLFKNGADILANDGKQYKLAVRLAESAGHHAAKQMAEHLYSIAANTLRSDTILGS
ncbi:ankyrin repeat-containing domain protein [Dendryphion nanum]|uniref:Ankyrin repeat-containing domain protein n=1 Tax=Dendryphion nanum TaxID=256645 RepID=A0A9P9IN19_9PLEO|nr:ankyrin repeat-containing domain protein [Dendryphion nanum]